MSDIWVIEVTTEQEKRRFHVLDRVVSLIPYLQTQGATNVGKKRKHDPEIFLTLPEGEKFPRAWASSSCHDGTVKYSVNLQPLVQTKSASLLDRQTLFSEILSTMICD